MYTTITGRALSKSDTISRSCRWEQIFDFILRLKKRSMSLPGRRETTGNNEFANLIIILIGLFRAEVRKFSALLTVQIYGADCRVCKPVCTHGA